MKLGTVRQTVPRVQMGVHIWCEILYMSSEIKILLGVCELCENRCSEGHTLLTGVN
jgi:hypothetical protein